MDREARLAGLEAYLNDRVKGQADAMHRLSRALQAAEYCLNDRGARPKGAYLFMGSRGIGKTESVKAFTEYLFGPNALAMLWMNEYQQASDVKALVNAVRRAVESGATVLLCDEIEKAHKAIIDIFISLLDEGQITDSEDGSRISVNDHYLAFTSNLGAHRWGEMLLTRYWMMEQFGFDEAKKHLRPELFNRFTETVVFRPLTQEVQIEILTDLLDKKLCYLERQLGKLSVHPEIHAPLLRKCFTVSEGARQIRTELDRQINTAVIPWRSQRSRPPEGCFRYDRKADQLILV
jgi:ATP-dependent Clp protease ATP-binding subunit ClpA